MGVLYLELGIKDGKVCAGNDGGELQESSAVV